MMKQLAFHEFSQLADRRDVLSMGPPFGSGWPAMLALLAYAEEARRETVELVVPWFRLNAPGLNWPRDYTDTVAALMVRRAELWHEIGD